MDDDAEISIDTSALDNEHITIEGGEAVVNFDDIVFADTAEYDTLNITMPDDYPSAFTALSDNDDAIAHLIDKPVSSGIEDSSPRK